MTADESASSSALLLKKCNEADALQKWKWREIYVD
ncbi:unnamed protein product [Anisakis simplex]|uniref:Uncharacterized protein n=1 Tax=Anisakis simplex TaxID=6269 RepID=A0A3P6PR81_ANISI|nr:unnamed protein product [Anisakis simplex]